MTNSIIDLIAQNRQIYLHSSVKWISFSAKGDLSRWLRRQIRSSNFDLHTKWDVISLNRGTLQFLIGIKVGTYMKWTRQNGHLPSKSHILWFEFQWIKTFQESVNKNKHCFGRVQCSFCIPLFLLETNSSELWAWM